MEGIKGKVALVTGGSRGIGRAVAIGLAREGARVALGYRVGRDKAMEAVAFIKEQGGEAVAVAADVASQADVEAMLQEVRTALGGPSILINNAGMHQHLKSWELPHNDWQRVLDVNLTGVFNCTKAALPDLMASGDASIVNISSVVAYIGTDHEVHYAASKGGVVSLTKSLALELAGKGVRVNAIAPGYIRTDMTDEATEEEKLAAIARVPMARMGEPSEIADVAVFLCSKRASYITGQVLHVNGGLAFP